MLMVERKALEINEFAHVRGWKEDTLLNAKALFGAPVRLPDTIIFLSTLTSVCLFSYTVIFFFLFKQCSLLNLQLQDLKCSILIKNK